MINKAYWKEFYSKQMAPVDASLFAEFCAEKFSELELEKSRIADIGCGNGRDTKYFAKEGFNIHGYDPVLPTDNTLEIFHEGDTDSVDLNAYDVFYLRFVVHAMEESKLDKFLQRLAETSGEKWLFFETRSTKGVTDEVKSETYFKSPIGTEHFRMLYSLEYLKEKCSKYFRIEYAVEDRDFAPFKEANPVIIRMILHKK